MTFDQIPAGSQVFLDANSLVYHFSNDANYGSACTKLVSQIEQQLLFGHTSSDVLADVAHRLMTLEAMNLNNWPQTGIAARLRRNHDEIPKLSLFEQAIASVPKLNIQVIPVTLALNQAATVVCKQHQLLTGDALVVSVMQAHGFANLA